MQHEALKSELQRGLVTLARFMELALYDPVHGFYGAAVAALGKAGHFITSVQVGPLFGQLLALQAIESWQKLGKPAAFDLIEQGAHNGRLAADILSSIQQLCPPLFTAARYHFIEPQAPYAAAQRALLEQESLLEKAVWHSALSEVAPDSLSGLFLSNELLDAMPVHQLVTTGETWQEQCVRWNADGTELEFFAAPLSDPALLEQSAAWPAPEQMMREVETAFIELRPAAQLWLQEACGILSAGDILIIDYGYSREEYLEGARQGTFTGYHQHQRSKNPLSAPGSQDLTAHVDFSAIEARAKSLGLRYALFSDQHHYLTDLAAPLLHAFEKASPETLRAFTRAFQTLTHPNQFGTRFRVMLLEKR